MSHWWTPSSSAQGRIDGAKRRARWRKRQQELEAQRAPRVLAVRYDDDGTEVVVHADERARRERF